MPVPTIDGFKAEAARLGATGRVDIAVPGSMPVPVDMSPLGETATNLGYISDAGVTEPRDEDREEFVPWQELTPIRSEITRSVASMSFVLWQSTIEANGFYYGFDKEDLMLAPDGSVVFDEKGKPTIKRHLLTLTVVDGTKARRIIFPNCEVTTREEVVHSSTEITALGVTVTAYPFGDEGLSVRRIWSEGWDTTGITGSIGGDTSPGGE